jgi:hypothetical protein
LAACHAVDRVVYEEDGDFLSAVSGVNNFGSSNGREVSITLIGDYDLVRAAAFHSSCRSGSASVRNLYVPGIKVVVGEH